MYADQRVSAYLLTIEKAGWGFRKVYCTLKNQGEVLESFHRTKEWHGVFGVFIAYWKDCLWFSECFLPIEIAGQGFLKVIKRTENNGQGFRSVFCPLKKLGGGFQSNYCPLKKLGEGYRSCLTEQKPVGVFELFYAHKKSWPGSFGGFQRIKMNWPGM